jgi:Rne/Rng family ribonuclease
MEAGQPRCLLAAPGAAATARRDWQKTPQDPVIEGPGAFATQEVWETVAELHRPRVPLDTGHMMIEPTHALTAVDVNTGSDVSPAAALKVNLAAARALPRQLRLRGIGGQITIDLAPLAKANRGQVERALAAALKSDGIVTTLAGWTPLGHLELVRKRSRRPLSR